MALVQKVLTHSEISATLGTGTRTATATITTTWNGVDDPVSQITVVEPNAMTPEELTTFQAFAAGLDELVADNEEIIQTEPA